MSQLGHPRRRDGAPDTSGLPQATDIIRPAQLVRLVPLPDSCTVANSTLLDHLVGAGERRRRHAEAERFSSLEVDYEIELLRPLNL